MAVFLAWTSVELPPEVQGPWEELRLVGPGLALVLSATSLSVVYHELKWSLPDDAALIVVPVVERPKLKGLAPGTTSWLREHV
jgi:hypothetical protein